MFLKLFSAQFRKPTGFFGRYIGNRMARGNQYEAEWTVSLLNLQPTDRVLEIGFGPGVAIQLVSQKVTNGQVVGIDLSATMVHLARQRNAPALQTGRVQLDQGDVINPPYPPDSFDKAFTIHTIYFWQSPADALKQLKRVLKADSLLAITMMTKDKWQPPPPSNIFTLYSPDDVQRFLTDAGFQQIQVKTSPEPDKFPGVCLLAVNHKEQ
ncbi:MAG TPA: class I SAM-dependent methyltransferase [Anaerolineae bacterium]|nr:class I SAM-dependent methyltransferase [Anaerolineae bacterium]